MTRKRGRGVIASGDDHGLWDRVSGTVKPLKRGGDRAVTRAVTPEAPKTEKKPVAETVLAPRRPTRSAAPPRESAAPLSAGKAAGIDARTLTRLRRGQTRIEARIDLHGMTQAEAYAALTEFVVDARNEARRTLLVITGRGTRAGPGGGVLRTQLPGWLNGPALRPHVLAFAPAQPKHGGAGAFYVYLRKGTPR